MPSTLIKDPRTTKDLASRGFKLNSLGAVGYGPNRKIGYSVVPLEYTAQTHGHYTGISKGLIERPSQRNRFMGYQPRDMAFRVYRPLANGQGWRQRPDAARFATAVAAAHYLLDLAMIPPFPVGALIREKETDWVGAITGPSDRATGEWWVGDPDFPDEDGQSIHQKDLHADWELVPGIKEVTR